jgi:hypothetical protein
MVNTRAKHRLEALIEDILELLRNAQGLDDPESVVKVMQGGVQDRLDAEFMLKRAKKATQLPELDELKADDLYRLFGMLRTPENRALLLEGIPQERVKVVESQLTQIKDELIPQFGRELRTFGQQLTRKRKGRRSKMPSEKVCRSVCQFIADLNTKKKIGIVGAQKRAALKWSVSFRVVERIWSSRTEYMANDED